MLDSDQRGIQGPTRVLVVLDQPILAELIRLTLTHGVHVVRPATDVDEATRVVAEWNPHLAVMDMELGGRRLLRLLGGGDGAGTRIPVIALTRRGDLKTKLDAFDRGVDDIMTMPFSPEELLARVLVVTRRTYGKQVQLQPVLRMGELELDILNRRVRVGGDELRLTGLEQSLLYLLAANAGRLITRDEIMDTLWGADYTAGSNVVDQHVRSLRQKLQDDWRKPRFITTVPRKGSRFILSAAVSLAGTIA
jgi:two-component system, OmpR family, KDP operon response regulator KdpE